MTQFTPSDPFAPPATAPSPNSVGARVAEVVSNGGFILIALGLLLNLLAWYRISGETQVAAQIPYVVSGALLGLGLIIAGAAVLVVQSQTRTRVALVEALAQLANTKDESSPVSQLASMTPENAAGLVVAGSSSYHLPGCRLVEGRDEASVLTAAEAVQRGLTACRVCKPEHTPQVEQRALHA